MDSLYAEVSRLKEFERREQALNASLDEHAAKWDARDAAYLTSLSPEERREHDLLQARADSYMKEQLGEELYNEYKS